MKFNSETIQTLLLIFALALVVFILIIVQMGKKREGYHTDNQGSCPENPAIGMLNSPF